MSDIFMSLLDEISSILETYRGRDKILRTLCYLSRLLGELQKNPELAKKFNIFGSQMSATRTAIRLLDDIPVLRNNILYKLGKNEPDKYMATFGVASNIIDQFYLILEKISWLAKHKLLTGVNNSKWDTATSACWVLTSYITVLKTLRYLVLLERHKGCIDKANSISPEKLYNLKRFHMWTVTRACMDFVHAVNTLPPGFLWSSKLKPLHVNLIGTTSSILGEGQSVANFSVICIKI